MSSTIGRPLARHGGPRRHGISLPGGRGSALLGDGVLIIVCAAVILAIVVANSAAPQPAAPGVNLYQVRLASFAGVSFENAQLASIGARVRIVPLESRCGGAGQARSGGTAQSQQRPPVGRWVGRIVASQAPRGSTTIVLASAQGLDTATFQVRGRVPACLPAVGSVRYW